ncbi:hypothetical protein [Helicobacter valdiviensis]|uniref:hypothetical protein n=1 Tax=Helicobacter valdiviensis TaxID=1458358 RepID=UPI0015EC2CD9|nr:hypothetical protein [Helicobacter valdiviensis]
MENLSQTLPKNKMKETSLKAIIGITCMFLGILPFIGVLFTLASWILFFIVLYDLTVYGGAKGLFKNFFMSLGTIFIGFSISIGAILILQPRVSLFNGLYFENNNAHAIWAVFACVIVFLITMIAVFPFMKAWYFEIARVTKQKYFIYAFWTHFIGLCTLPVFGLGALGIIASIIFQLAAWISFNNESLENSHNSHQKQSFIFDFDLKWVKILMVASLLLSLMLNLLHAINSILKDSFDIISYYRLMNNFVIFFELVKFSFSNTAFLTTFLVILALLSVFLFCKKLNSYKIFSYFFLWQTLFIARSYQSTIFNFILGENYPHSMDEIVRIILRIALIISAFLFFKVLVQATKNKFFFAIFAIFAIFACRETLRILLNLFDFNYNITDIMRNSGNFLDFIYIVLFIATWLSLKGNKNSLKS